MKHMPITAYVRALNPMTKWARMLHSFSECKSSINPVRTFLPSSYNTPYCAIIQNKNVDNVYIDLHHYVGICTEANPAFLENTGMFSNKKRI
jgi:hypothetical protein